MTPDTNLKDKFAGLSPTNLRIEPGANTQGCDLFYTTDEQDPLGDTGTPYTDGKIGFKWAEQPSPVVFKCVHCVATAKPKNIHAAAAVGASGVHDDNMMKASLNNSSTFESSATVFICAWGRYECALVGSTRLMLAALPLLADTSISAPAKAHVHNMFLNPPILSGLPRPQIHRADRAPGAANGAVRGGRVLQRQRTDPSRGCLGSCAGSGVATHRCQSREFLEKTDGRDPAGG